MGIIVGIDLGTTNSCVAVHEGVDVPAKDELVRSGRLQRVGRALVVTDRYRSPVTPSAVWVAPDGKILIGTAAQEMLRVPDEPPPAMFFKRAMGSTERIVAGHAELTAVELSTHVLAYLKSLAEQALSVRVDRAVVTVPALFEDPAKIATTEAAVAAGIEVAETMLEPAAASLAYLDEGHDTTLAPGCFLVYDLGGGTFDVTVVDWDADGQFDARAADGDRFVGGYDFDKALLDWVVDELPSYDLEFRDDNPEDMRIRGQLLADLESVKIDLTRTTHTTLHEQRLHDRQGARMSIKLPIDRARFAALIGPTVQRTIGIADRALAAAGVTPEEIDDIVLAGGSTRVPSITETLEAHYGRRPRQLDPDLCVGIGAALRTAALGTVTDTGLEIRPLIVDGATALIGGRVRPTDPDSAVADRQIELRTPGGSLVQGTTSGADGRFALEIPLSAMTERLHLKIVLDGTSVDSHPIDPPGADGSTGPDFPPVVSRTIFVHVAAGMLPIAAAGTTIPAERTLPLYTRSHGSSVVVPVYEGHTHIGQVVLDDIPRDLPVGTRVDVVLQFTENWRIEAAVRIPGIGRERHAHMHMRTVEAASWEELALRYRTATDIWLEKQHLLGKDDLIRLGPPIDDLVDEIPALLASRSDRQKTNARVEELETKVTTLPAVVLLSPPWATFEQLLNRLEVLCEQIAAQRGDVDASRFREALPVLRRTGGQAYSASDQRAWDASVNGVRGQMAEAQRILEPNPGPSTPDPRSHRASLHIRIDTTLRGIRDHDRETKHKHVDEAAELIEEGLRIAAQLDGVDIDAPDATSRLNSIEDHELKRWLADASRFPGGQIVLGAEAGDPPG